MKNLDITAILTFYKRPHVIHEQIQSLRNQTIKPKKIIIWINHIDGYKFPEDLFNDKELTIIHSTQNFGVWARFAIGLLANTEFIAVFDDDTIPGKKWFQNCLDTMSVVNGLLGTIGLIFSKGNRYQNETPRQGWEGKNKNIVQVDIVGHAWFFRRKWINYLFTFTPDYEKLLTCGEDIAFSWALQRAGINTYVPPHPEDDPDMFGSNPEKAWKYGTEKVAISLQSDSGSKFDQALKLFIDLGFKKIRD